MLHYFARLPGRIVHCLRQEVQLRVNGGESKIEQLSSCSLPTESFPAELNVQTTRTNPTLHIHNSHTTLLMASYLLHFTSPHPLIISLLFFMKCQPQHSNNLALQGVSPEQQTSQTKCCHSIVFFFFFTLPLKLFCYNGANRSLCLSWNMSVCNPPFLICSVTVLL